VSWPAALVVLALLCGAGALTALLQPWVLLCLARTDAVRRFEARREARCSGFIIFCALAWMANLSFAGHALNVIAIVVVVICAGSLAMFAFGLRPTVVGLSVGLMATGAFLLGLLFCLEEVLVHGNSPATAQLDDGLVCRETVYGFVTSDSGELMEIYRRYLFIDHRIYHRIHSDIDPDNAAPPPAGIADTLARCQAAVNAQRSAAAHGS
jgi:hypothetical protein